MPPCCVGAIFLKMRKKNTGDDEEKEIKVVYGRCALHRGRRYRAYECGGVCYWEIGDIKKGIPAAVRAGMRGFRLDKYLVPEPVRKPAAGKGTETAGGAAVAQIPASAFNDVFKPLREPVPFGTDMEPDRVGLQEPPRPVREVSADYGIRKSPYAGDRVYGQSGGAGRESEPAENSCLLVVHGVTESGKFRLTQGLELEYRGSQKLGNVDKIAFIPSHIDDVRGRGWFDDEDCTRIESRQIGKCVESDKIYAGVYSIRLAGSNRRKIAYCGNLFDSISVDLRRSRNLNFRRDVYENGLRGAVIYISPIIEKEDDRVRKRAEKKREIEDKGGEVYLNEEIEASGYETVKRYDELRGFRWRLPDEAELHGVKSENIVMSMYDVYETCGGKELGMFFQLL